MSINRRKFLGLAAAGVATCALSHKSPAQTTSTSPKADARVIIDDVDCYRVLEPMHEAVRVVLAQRGEKYTPAYVQGISGAAFRIAGICPCAPTVSGAMGGPEALLKLLGYEFATFPLSTDGLDPAKRVVEMIPKVRDEIRAGRAVMVWHAFTNAEWDVVCGFDDEKKLFLGRGSYTRHDYYASAPEARAREAVNICPAFGALFIGKKTGQFDAAKAEVAALKEAIRHAHDQKNVDKQDGEKWVMLEGLAAYDRWVKDWQDPKHKRGSGDSYCYGIYRSTHRAAGAFLREIAPKYVAGKAELLAAAAHFIAEADALDEAEPMLGWSAPERQGADRCAKAAEILSRAMERYKQGIGQIEAAVPKLS